MAYGIELRGPGGNLILNEQLSTIVVIDSFTLAPAILGTYDFATQTFPNIITNGWIAATGIFTAQGAYQDIPLNGGTGYTTAPIVAQRSTDGGKVIRPWVIFNPTTSRYDTVRVYGELATTGVEVLILASSGDPAFNLNDVGTDTYGLQIRNNSNEVTFDSRWDRQVIFSQTLSFPDVMPMVNFFGNVDVSNTGVSRDLDFASSGAFFILGGVTGTKRYNPQSLFAGLGGSSGLIGGGQTHPAVSQTSPMTVELSAAISSDTFTGLPNTDPYSGSVLILRYMGAINPA